MLKGWDEQELFNLSVQRKVAIIISETINRSMGGRGVVDQIMKAFVLPGEEEKITDMTPERIKRILKQYQENMAKRRNKPTDN